MIARWLSLAALLALSACKPEAEPPPPLRPVLSVKADVLTRATEAGIGG